MEGDTQGVEILFVENIGIVVQRTQPKTVYYIAVGFKPIPVDALQPKLLVVVNEFVLLGFP